MGACHGAPEQARRPAGVAAYAQLAGRPLRREHLEPPSALNRTDTACARSGGAGIVTDASEIGALASAVDLVDAVEEAAGTTPAEKYRAPETACTSRPSRATALRHARAAMAATAEASSGSRIAAVDPAACAPAVVEVVAACRPKARTAASWTELRPVWERLIVDFAPAGRGAVGDPASVLVDVLRWAREGPGRPDANAPLALDELLDGGSGGSLVDAYDEQLHAEGVVDFSRATRCAALCRALRSLDPRTANTRAANTDSAYQTGRWTHVVVLVESGLMVVIARAATNLRCLQAWAARTRDRSDPITHLDPEDDGFEEIDQATASPARTGPPAAAGRPRLPPAGRIVMSRSPASQGPLLHR